MPNRILHERICVSETIAQLTADEERFFYRLIVQCDDYGRFDGRASVIRARCFSLQIDEISDEDVGRWLAALESVGLVAMYEVDGRAFLRVTTWSRYQQTRAQHSKYPAPEDGSQASDSNGYQAPAHVPVSGIREARIEKRSSIDEKRESVSEHAVEPDHGAAAPPKPKRGGKAARTLPPDVLEPNAADYAAGERLGMSREDIDSKAALMLDHWRAKGELRADWHASLRTWLANAEKFDQPRAGNGNRNGGSMPPQAWVSQAPPPESSRGEPVPEFDADPAATSVWNAALEELRLGMSQANFESYLGGTVGVSLEGDQVTVAVTNPLVREALEQRFRQHILRALLDVRGSPCRVKIVAGRARAPNGVDADQVDDLTPIVE